MIGWLDLSAGASGDMLLGALVGAGVPVEVLQRAVDALGVEPVRLRVEQVERAGLGATRVHVEVTESGVRRTWSDVRVLLERAGAPASAHVVFARLAHAEARVHGVDPEQVHFHEVGALDALADVVGVCTGVAHLGLTRLVGSRVTLGSGTARGAHGPLPVPVPAVLELLRGVPVQAGPVPREMTTPTGAALLSVLVDAWDDLPAMAPVRTGTGAGGRDPQEVANVVRLVLGDDHGQEQRVLLLETNVDDLDPRLWPGVLQALLDVGAHDAWLTPVLMKKGRPAHVLSVLVPPSEAAAARRTVFRETSTLGLRETGVRRTVLERREATVQVDGVPVRVKLGLLDGEVVNAQPEWEDVAAAARAGGRPAKQVLRDAQARLPREAGGPRSQDG